MLTYSRILVGKYLPAEISASASELISALLQVRAGEIGEIGV